MKAILQCCYNNVDGRFHCSKTTILMSQTKIINWYLNKKLEKLNKKMFWEISITTKGKQHKKNTFELHTNYSNDIYFPLQPNYIVV
jgi:hypothetical protein